MKEMSIPFNADAFPGKLKMLMEAANAGKHGSEYKGEALENESCIVKTDCSKSENMVKYFQESERDEKENELHKGV